MSKFSWVEFAKQVGSVNKDEPEKGPFQYLILELDTPIPVVVGSTTLFDPDTDERIPVTQNDVTTVRVSLDVIANNPDGFHFDEDANGNLTGSGSYSGNLMLDVSSKDDVWLVDEKFKDFGRKSRKNKSSARMDAMIQRYSRISRTGAK